jgi:hypothetical protein
MVSSGLLSRVVVTRATRRNNPEDTILHSHRRENLKSYIVEIASTSELCPFVSEEKSYTSKSMCHPSDAMNK